MNPFNLSIVIPMYNEAKRIRETLLKIKAYLKSQTRPVEIVVVDDGSSDDSLRIVRDNLKDIPHQILENSCNRGKGFSVKAGMLAAKGEYLLFSDADLSAPIEELDRFLPILLSGYDCVIGSRALPESDIGIHQSAMRESMGRVFNRVARWVSFRDIQDSQCGFKLFRREAAQQVFSRQKLDGFSFDAEILYLAQKLGYRIKEVSVKWNHSAQTRVHLIWDPIKMFFDLLRIRFLHGRIQPLKETAPSSGA